MSQTETTSMKTQAKNLIERGKEIAEEGQHREIVFVDKSGKRIFKTTFTIAAAIAVVLLVTGIVSFPMIAIISVIGMLMGIRIEIRTTDV